MVYTQFVMLEHHFETVLLKITKNNWNFLQAEALHSLEFIHNVI